MPTMNVIASTIGGAINPPIPILRGGEKTAPSFCGSSAPELRGTLAKIGCSMKCKDEF